MKIVSKEELLMDLTKIAKKENVSIGAYLGAVEMLGGQEEWIAPSIKIKNESPNSKTLIFDWQTSMHDCSAHIRSHGITWQASLRHGDKAKVLGLLDLEIAAIKEKELEKTAKALIQYEQSTKPIESAE